MFVKGITNGARVEQVDEPLTTFIFELEAYPEAKALSSEQLLALHKTLGTFGKIAQLIGSSECFASQNARPKKKSKLISC